MEHLPQEGDRIVEQVWNREEIREDNIAPQIHHNIIYQETEITEEIEQSGEGRVQREENRTAVIREENRTADVCTNQIQQVTEASEADTLEAASVLTGLGQEHIANA